MSAVAGPHARVLACGVPSLVACVHACMPGHRNAPRDRAIVSDDQDLLRDVCRDKGPATLAPGALRCAECSCISGAGSSSACTACP